jgi:hypothetical protein
MRFKDWIIKESKIYGYKDIFGFEKEFFPIKNKDSEKPIKSFHTEQMIESLGRYSVGQLLPEVRFSNEVRWGQGTGSLRVWTGTKGGLMIERLGHDLHGNPRWITKRRFQINQSGIGGFEDSVTEEVMDEVQKVHEAIIDSPKNDFEGTDHLAIRLASALKRTFVDELFYAGIRKLTEHNYIIRFQMRGQGVQAPQQHRIEENHTQVSYDKDAGYLKIMNYNVESSLGEHKWKVMPSHIEWCFFPTQNEDEIIQAVANYSYWF